MNIVFTTPIDGPKYLNYLRTLPDTAINVLVEDHVAEFPVNNGRTLHTELYKRITVSFSTPMEAALWLITLDDDQTKAAQIKMILYGEE